MLSLLHIENIALIDFADISFGPGLNVLSGETGAGKSIVLDSISALMGERTSRDLIRTGEKAARVTGVFCDLPALPWFEENGIAPDENGELLVQRQISADGKNICRVGGQPCTVAQLRVLGRQLINIHGQHDGQQLLDESSHLRYLDSFGALDEPLTRYQECYQALTALRKKLTELDMDEGEKSRRIDTLQFQIKELTRAELTVGEEEALLERRNLLRNSGKLTDAVERSYLAFSGDEEMEGALSLLRDAQHAMENVAGLSEEVGTLAERVAQLSFQAEDLGEQVRDLRDRFDSAPEELDQVEGRLDLLYRLKKKYGGSVEEMLAYLERCQEELESIEMSDDLRQKLEKEERVLYTQALEQAKLLSAARKTAAERMRGRIEQELSELDMPKVRFQAEFQPPPKEDHLESSGMDTVQFLMSANVGEELKPIQKVASGGELSRIMLALKNVLTENDSVTTLIFDEVDAGVSGRAAQRVAEKMAQLGGKRQLLCVTHLAQIAAMANAHFSVDKAEREGRTYTQVALLSDEGRVEELARLTGGAHISEAIRGGARELLDAAAAYRKKRT